ncbi:hypothetical protein FIV42_13465 [Persicimonas caeni]|uniref:Uncharacterized protein n=1 Tax=Persicimonas caeni TaxID=2292766 RepID=A0A4Y6PTU2_PERCE|nr:hypothetical protein [Persicimonas caeni]QDG51718.1 hypothetical protein FIV42_13465 [Persicimonas caeni]QED32939.1 hypothetical protein FRD00_13460 [Persicimonas caeni]
MANDTTADVGLLQRAENLLKDIRSHARRVSRAKDLLAAVKGKEPSSKSYAEWLEIERGLGGYELGVPELDAQRAELIEALGAEMKKLRIKARMAFMQKLEMLAEAQDIALEKLSEAPLVLFADPLTFEIDFDAGGARLLYGHEPICELPLDAKELLGAHQTTVEELERRTIPSEDFFDRLRAAYRMVLAADGTEKGDRVDLVDVLVPLSVLGLERKDWRNKGPGALEPYPRHLLAWQLAKLRRDGVLERGGVRLDLGAATGGSTKNKQNVLYIPVGAKNGQYYGSLRFG